MPGTELIPPTLPELPHISLPHSEVFQPVVEALSEYEHQRKYYEQIAGTFRQNDVERRENPELQRSLDTQEQVLSTQLKQHLVFEHLAQGSPRPRAETTEQLAERLLSERYERGTTLAPKPRFTIKKMFSRFNPKTERQQTARAVSDAFFEELIKVQRQQVHTRNRLLDLNETKGSELVQTQAAFNRVSGAFKEVATAVDEASIGVNHMLQPDRQLLNSTLKPSISAARAMIDAGQAIINAHAHAQLPPALQAHYAMGIEPDGRSPPPLPRGDQQRIAAAEVGHDSSRGGADPSSNGPAATGQRRPVNRRGSLDLARARGVPQHRHGYAPPPSSAALPQQGPTPSPPRSSRRR